MEYVKEQEKTTFDEFNLDRSYTKTDILYIGIDLGTSRSSIATNNGVRTTVASVVGWPKDTVARKMIGKEMVFGEEALEKRLSLDLIRPLEQGVIKNSELADDGNEEALKYTKAAKELIKYIISLAQPREDQYIYGVIGAPAQASIHNKKAIIQAAKEVLDAVLIVSEPFAVAYGMNKLNDALVVDIGAGTTDLCRMHGAIPSDEDQITIPVAGDHVDQLLYALLEDKCPDAQFNMNMVRKIKETHGFVRGVERRVNVQLPVNGKPVSYDITDEVREACSSLISPILNAIYKLISSFDPEFQHKLRNNVLLAGGGSQMLGLDRAIEEGLQKELGGGKVSRVEEPLYAGANGALKLAQEMPQDYWERLS